MTGGRRWGLVDGAVGVAGGGAGRPGDVHGQADGRPGGPIVEILYAVIHEDQVTRVTARPWRRGGSRSPAGLAGEDLTSRTADHRGDDGGLARLPGRWTVSAIPMLVPVMACRNFYAGGVAGGRREVTGASMIQDTADLGGSVDHGVGHVVGQLDREWFADWSFFRYPLRLALVAMDL